VVPRKASCGASGLEGTTGSHSVGTTTRATGEPRERRCAALARRDRRERAPECAKRRAFEFQGVFELARGIRSRGSGRASELARAEAASVTGRGCRGPGALGAPRTLESRGALEGASAGARPKSRGGLNRNGRWSSRQRKGVQGSRSVGIGRRVLGRASGSALDGQGGLTFTTSGRRSPEAPLRQHWRWRGRRTRGRVEVRAVRHSTA